MPICVFSRDLSVLKWCRLKVALVRGASQRFGQSQLGLVSAVVIFSIEVRQLCAMGLTSFDSFAASRALGSPPLF